MSRRIARALAVVAAVVAIGGNVAALVGTLATGATFQSMVEDYLLTNFGIGVSFAVVGIIILWRQPGHRMGVLLLTIGFISGFTIVTSGFAEWDVSRGIQTPGLTGVAVWLGNWLWIPAVSVMVVGIPLLFPTGHPPTPRWRIVGWVGAVGATLIIVASAGGLWSTRMDLLLETAPTDADLAPAGLPATISGIGYGIVTLAAIAAIISLVQRYRRAGPEVRQQMKLVVFVLALVIPLVTVVINNQTVGPLVLATAIPLIPGSIGVAIVRHRLFDIDLVISRALVYGALAVFITGAYVAVVVGVGSLVGRGGEPDLALSVVATAVVAIAFEPARARLQRVANRLVYGARATPYEVLAEFTHQMADALSADDVLPRMAEAAAGGVGATAAQVTVQLPHGGTQSVTLPHAAAEPDDWTRRLPVEHQGRVVGEIAVALPSGQPLSAAGSALLEDLARQAGLALHRMGLTVELEAQLARLEQQAEQVRASRQRLVAARDTERRRMERDIHDGAQQSLVAMSVKLGLAEQLLSRDATKSAELLTQVEDDIQTALDALRDLARGVFPPLLVEQGLQPALESHARKHGLDVTVTGNAAGVRFEQTAEVAAYFCCLEAMQNATKHAPGAPITVALTFADDVLTVVVHDDGPGFDPANIVGGSGLQNMRDRIEALGGSVEIVSAPGQGTEVRTRLPLAVALAV